jgi:O-acetyl-ADP-ribose deacetylase (regulator of RNase III)
VSVKLGPYDDSDIGLVVKAQNIPVGISSPNIIGSTDSTDGFGVTIREAVNAGIVRHWPSVSIQDPDRRKVVYQTVVDALIDAELANVSSVGLFTLALEVSRVPSWEVAEEITKAVYDHATKGTTLDKIIIVASSPIQVSSFQFALSNIKIIRSD